MFIDWSQAPVYAVIVTALFGGIWLFRKVRSTTPRLRIPIKICSALVASISLLIFLLLLGVELISKSTNSELLNHRRDRPPYKCGGTFSEIQVFCIPNTKSSGGL